MRDNDVNKQDFLLKSKNTPNICLDVTHDLCQCDGNYHCSKYYVTRLIPFSK